MACCYKRRKLHLGVDSALKTLLVFCELVCDEEDGVPCYRLPTEEEWQRWQRESDGVDISDQWPENEAT